MITLSSWCLLMAALWQTCSYVHTSPIQDKDNNQFVSDTHRRKWEDGNLPIRDIDEIYSTDEYENQIPLNMHRTVRGFKDLFRKKKKESNPMPSPEWDYNTEYNTPYLYQSDRIQSEPRIPRQKKQMDYGNVNKEVGDWITRERRRMYGLDDEEEEQYEIGQEEPPQNDKKSEIVEEQNPTNTNEIPLNQGRPKEVLFARQKRRMYMDNNEDKDAPNSPNEDNERVAPVQDSNSDNDLQADADENHIINSIENKEPPQDEDRTLAAVDDESGVSPLGSLEEMPEDDNTPSLQERGTPTKQKKIKPSDDQSTPNKDDEPQNPSRQHLDEAQTQKYDVDYSSPPEDKKTDITYESTSPFGDNLKPQAEAITEEIKSGPEENKVEPSLNSNIEGGKNQEYRASSVEVEDTEGDAKSKKLQPQDKPISASETFFANQEHLTRNEPVTASMNEKKNFDERPFGNHDKEQKQSGEKSLPNVIEKMPKPTQDHATPSSKPDSAIELPADQIPSSTSVETDNEITEGRHVENRLRSRPDRKTGPRRGNDVDKTPTRVDSLPPPNDESTIKGSATVEQKIQHSSILSDENKSNTKHNTDREEAENTNKYANEISAQPIDPMKQAKYVTPPKLLDEDISAHVSSNVPKHHNEGSNKETNPSHGDVLKTPSVDSNLGHINGLDTITSEAPNAETHLNDKEPFFTEDSKRYNTQEKTQQPTYDQHIAPSEGTKQETVQELPSPHIIVQKSTILSSRNKAVEPLPTVIEEKLHTYEGSTRSKRRTRPDSAKEEIDPTESQDESNYLELGNQNKPTSNDERLQKECVCKESVHGSTEILSQKSVVGQNINSVKPKWDRSRPAKDKAGDSLNSPYGSNRFYGKSRTASGANIVLPHPHTKPGSRGTLHTESESDRPNKNPVATSNRRITESQIRQARPSRRPPNRVILLGSKKNQITSYPTDKTDKKNLPVRSISTPSTARLQGKSKQMNQRGVNYSKITQRQRETHASHMQKIERLLEEVKGLLDTVNHPNPPRQPSGRITSYPPRPSRNVLTNSKEIGQQTGRPRRKRN